MVLALALACRQTCRSAECSCLLIKWLGRGFTTFLIEFISPILPRFVTVACRAAPVCDCEQCCSCMSANRECTSVMSVRSDQSCLQ